MDLYLYKTELGELILKLNVIYAYIFSKGKDLVFSGMLDIVVTIVLKSRTCG